MIIQFVDEASSYLCGYLRIQGLTQEFPTLTTFFDGEIISARYPFLTRKWDADEGKWALHFLFYRKRKKYIRLKMHFELPFNDE